MMLAKARYKKDTIGAIKYMNKVLHTNFSYVYCIEETEFLNKIPKGLDVTNKLRLEHLSTVLGLWNKGLLEDYIAHNKRNRNYDKIKPLFETFLGCYVRELYKNKIIDDYDTHFDYSIEKDSYSINFKDYDYVIKKERMSDIKMLIDVVDSFRKVIENDVNSSSEEYLSKFIKFKYYGPMSCIFGYKTVKKNFKKTNRFYRKNPYNKVLNSRFLFRYNMALNKCDRCFDRDYKNYYSLMLNYEKDRLKLEYNRIDYDNTRYDYYFDYYMYRLKNDVEYLFLKRLGGIRKVCDLINIYDKSKSVLDKTAITVDVDNMIVVDKKNNKSGGNNGGIKKGKSMDIKSFDDLNREVIIREERKEYNKEHRELGRRR